MSTLLIAGTTASGKSSLAIELAIRYDAVIVSADAMTVYKGLDVGTAKPSLDEQAAAPHLGLDLREIDQPFDVSDFVALVEGAQERHSRVIIAGGTTFWLSALIRPLAPLPPSDPDVRARLEAIQDPHRALAEVDPVAAARLHPNDRVRVVRALEVFHLTGETQTSIHAKGPRREPMDANVIWLDRDDLRERIDLRLSQMQEAGYLDETQRALETDPLARTKPLQSFAYRHIIDHARGDTTLDEAIRRTSRDTWQYARKQRTWARNLGWARSERRDIEELAKATFERRA